MSKTDIVKTELQKFFKEKNGEKVRESKLTKTIKSIIEFEKLLKQQGL